MVFAREQVPYKLCGFWVSVLCESDGVSHGVRIFAYSFWTFFAVAMFWGLLCLSVWMVNLLGVLLLVD